MLIEGYFLKSNSDFYYSTEKTMRSSKASKKDEMSFEEKRFEFVEKYYRKPTLDKVRVDKILADFAFLNKALSFYITDIKDKNDFCKKEANPKCKIFSQDLEKTI